MSTISQTRNTRQIIARGRTLFWRPVCFPFHSRKGKVVWANPTFSTSAVRRARLFDTLKVVEVMRSQGFTKKQADVVVKVLGNVLHEYAQTLSEDMAPKKEQRKVILPTLSLTSQILLQQSADFAKLQRELRVMDSNEETKAEYVRMSHDIDILRQNIKEDLTKMQAEVRLDLNLEKDRLEGRSNDNELKIKQIDNRVQYSSPWMCSL
jgi:Protein of unknown function (DUF1640)